MQLFGDFRHDRVHLGQVVEPHVAAAGLFQQGSNDFSPGFDPKKEPKWADVTSEDQVFGLILKRDGIYLAGIANLAIAQADLLDAMSAPWFKAKFPT